MTPPSSSVSAAHIATVRKGLTLGQGLAFEAGHDWPPRVFAALDALASRIDTLEAKLVRIGHIAENIADPYNKDGRRIKWAEDIAALVDGAKEEA